MTWNMALDYVIQYVFSNAPMDSVGAYSHGCVIGGAVCLVSALVAAARR